MRILVLTEEDELYIPLSLEYLLNQLDGEILEVACIRNPLLPGKIATAKKFVKVFGLLPLLKYGIRLTVAKFLDKFDSINLTGRHYSVKKVCQAHNITYTYYTDVNSRNFIEHCRALNVELIAAVSPSQILKKELLSLPPHGCINIHTAKLPKYRGLYPTYWAMAEGEEKLGISIHYMEEGIDTGRIILQDEIDIPQGTTLNNMLKTSKVKGAQLLTKAIKQIREGVAQSFYAREKGSYYSFPTRDSYVKFRNRGYKMF